MNKDWPQAENITQEFLKKGMYKEDVNSEYCNKCLKEKWGCARATGHQYQYEKGCKLFLNLVCKPLIEEEIFDYVKNFMIGTRFEFSCCEELENITLSEAKDNFAIQRANNHAIDIREFPIIKYKWFSGIKGDNRRIWKELNYNDAWLYTENELFD